MSILRTEITLNAVICIVCSEFSLNNEIITTPKTRILSSVFAVLCLKKSLSIRIINMSRNKLYVKCWTIIF